jgi:hypothetical protein
MRSLFVQGHYNSNRTYRLPLRVPSELARKQLMDFLEYLLPI